MVVEVVSADEPMATVEGIEGVVSTIEVVAEDIEKVEMLLEDPTPVGPPVAEIWTMLVEVEEDMVYME
jgi:hypothetical protein